MHAGVMRHEESNGNNGIIEAGDVQWMTAGNGIIHEEMPGQEEGLLHGFQVWVNLPADKKFTNPRYQKIKADTIPLVEADGGNRVKIICGIYQGKAGPVKDTTADIQYLDVHMNSDSRFMHEIKESYTVFVYVYEGDGFFVSNARYNAGSLIVYEREGSRITIETHDNSLKFLLISGKPLQEPIAWHGPIVMNTREELQQAFDDYENGDFIKVAGKEDTADTEDTIIN
jgi:hypothetical protein